MILIATDHKEYGQKDYTKLIKLTQTPTILFDGRGIIDPNKLPPNLYFTGIGRGEIKYIGVRRS